ncbi:rhamnogalacturonan acetylesterase [Naasia sp. SYSU D00948]|uniref:rhamnogalacturonan acetylesterase n=1 Tax=Naasia sp. SYSU D00948 TaxID=2817379 RepID=UPI001B317214|nr:rhamnogalacturonan acetylesterase [Naasia sp. SYSU D00948]
MTYHLAGDSTVAACPDYEQPMSGWGPHLGPLVDAPVRNLAFGGATTESFLAEGVWGRLLEEVAPGDTVILQFGHNDQKQPELLGSRGGYTDRLSRMIADVRARGATAVLCTSVERRYFDGGTVRPSHGDYPNAVRDLGHALDVPVIDLTVFTSWLYEELGDEESKHLLSHFAPGRHPHWPDGLEDNTHFHERGAKKVAAFVARSLRAIERRDGDRESMGSQFLS